MYGPPPPNQPAPDSGIGSLSESPVRVRAPPCARQPAFVPAPTQPAGPTVSSPVVYQPTTKRLTGPTGNRAVTNAPNPSSENGSPRRAGRSPPRGGEGPRAVTIAPSIWMSPILAPTVAPTKKVSPKLWPARDRSSTTIPSSVTRMSFVALTPSRATYMSAVVGIPPEVLAELRGVDLDVDRVELHVELDGRAVVVEVPAERPGHEHDALDTERDGRPGQPLGRVGPDVRRLRLDVDAVSPETSAGPGADPDVARQAPLRVGTGTVAVVGGVPGGEPAGGGMARPGDAAPLPGQPRYSPPDAPPPAPQVMSPTSRPQTALAFLSALSTLVNRRHRWK